MSKEITATELHVHIQSTIFGKAAKKDAARFDELQEKLHEIVDWYFEQDDDDDDEDDEEMTEPE